MSARYHIYQVDYVLVATTGTASHTFYSNPVAQGTVQVQGVQSNATAWENVVLWVESQNALTFDWKIQYNGVDQAVFATVTAAAGPKKVFSESGPVPGSVAMTAQIRNVGAGNTVVRCTWVGLCRNPMA